MVQVRTALEEMGKDGAFKRKEAGWRNWISRGKLLMTTSTQTRLLDDT